MGTGSCSRGREFIHELGIYDYRHRMYQPQLGRFLQTDPIGLQTEGEKLSAGQKALFLPGFQAPEAFTTSEMNLYRYCGDDPVDNSDPLGLDFSPYEGGPIPADTIRAGSGLGLTVPNIKVVPVRQDDGTFMLRLDVKILEIYVAERVHFHSKTKLTVRSAGEKRVTFEEHEKREHGEDWRRFHDENQSKIPGTRYSNPDAAKEAAEALTNKFKTEAFKANQKFEQHQPEKRWRNIRNRELPR